MDRSPKKHAIAAISGTALLTLFIGVMATVHFFYPRHVTTTTVMGILRQEAEGLTNGEQPGAIKTFQVELQDGSIASVVVPLFTPFHPKETVVLGARTSSYSAAIGYFFIKYADK